MVIERIESGGRWAAALALALAVTAPAALSAGDANNTSDQPVVSAPATAVTAGPDIAPATPPAPETAPAVTATPTPATEPASAPATASAEPAPAPAASSSDKPSGMTAATTQVKNGASQISEGKVLSGTGELGKGVGNTVVEGTKATGRGIVRVGQVTGYGIRQVWNTTFDAVIDAGDATVTFVKGMFDF